MRSGHSVSFFVDCGELGELDVEVFYDYQPPEKATYWYPGCDEEFKVTGVFYKGRDLTWLMGDHLQDSEALAEKIHDYEIVDRDAARADFLYDQMREDRYV